MREDHDNEKLAHNKNYASQMADFGGMYSRRNCVLCRDCRNSDDDLFSVNDLFIRLHRVVYVVAFLVPLCDWTDLLPL